MLTLQLKRHLYSVCPFDETFDSFQHFIVDLCDRLQRHYHTTCLDDMEPKEGISALPTDQIASKSNILNIYKLTGLEEAYGDINNLPSMKSRMKVRNRNDIYDKGFCTVESL